MRNPRFELVRTDAGHHARFRAANGRVLFSTGSQVYSRKKDALNAINVLVNVFGGWLDGSSAVEQPFRFSNLGRLEIRELDERSGGAR